MCQGIEQDHTYPYGESRVKDRTFSRLGVLEGTKDLFLD